jgi:hypothetical protein
MVTMTIAGTAPGSFPDLGSPVSVVFDEHAVL